MEKSAVSEVVSVSEVAVGNTGTATSDTKLGRYWMFTINNYNDEDVKLMNEWKELAVQLVVAKEVGENGTPHLQGFIGFKGMKRLAAMKKMHSRAHWELSRSKDAAIYCCKEGGEVLINASNKKQGKRSDIHDVKDAISKNATMKELWNEFPEAMVKFHKGIEIGSKYWNPKRVKITHTLDSFIEPAMDLSLPVVLWGPTNIGKTCFAKAHFNNPLLVSHMDDLLEFTSDHDGIIFDDMSFRHMPRSTQIHITDTDEDRSLHCRYRCAEIPAGTKKIFCTNEEGGFCLDLNDPAVMRRVRIVHVNKLIK